MRNTPFIVFFALALLAVLALSPAQAQDKKDAFTSILKPAFATHCVKCHGKTGKPKGKVNLFTLKSATDLTSRPQLLEDMINALKDRDMPPEKEPPLKPQVRQAMINTLHGLLKQAQARRVFAPTPIRRMNRFQYNNAVVDLLELDRDIFRLNERLLRRYNDYFKPETGTMTGDVKVAVRPLSKDIDGRRAEGFMGVAAFPQDKRAEHGFDNRADHLTLSPLLMESFLRLSQTIVESKDLNAREVRSWNHLFAAPGQAVSHSAAGKYEAENGRWLKLVGKPPGRVWNQNMKGFGKQWSGNTHVIWMCKKANHEIQFNFKTTEAGQKLRIGYTKAPDYGIFQIFIDGKKVGKPVDLFDPRVVRADDIHLKLKLKPGAHTLRIQCTGKNGKSRGFYFGMDYFEVAGQQKKKAGAGAGTTAGTGTQADVLRTRIKKLLRRAFRRPVDPATLDRFVAFANKSLKNGVSFTDTMKTIVGATIASPDFLYLYNTQSQTARVAGQDASPQKLDDFELASRLSFFLWSSIPDDTLLDLAEAGQLSDPKILGEQIDRMLNDKRMLRFCDNFPAQWLQLEKLITAIPDKKKYPYFYYNGYRTSMHMMPEPLLLFETILIEDRSIMELIDPKFTWQSDMLRANYEGHAKGRRSVNVFTFKRVPLTDPRRGGVITNAAVMTMTSTPVRTQPITRGAWVNAVVFNDPPEPPPADVPPLPKADEEAIKKLTIRERLALHRKRADCANCHNQIDPLGFALENYGPTGVWRDKYENGRDVDVSGKLYGQFEFDTLLEFKQLIVKQKHRFIRGFAAHLLSYGLGRELTPADSPALDAVTAKALAGQDNMRSVLKQVAMSEPFMHKNTQYAPVGAAKHE